jgi:hypothetical protein
MKRQIIRKLVDGSPRYYVREKKNIFSKWEDVKFVDKEGNSRDYLEDVVELNNRYWGDIDWGSEICMDYRKVRRELDKKDHETPYRIMKYQDEHTNVCDVICKAKTIGELSDGYHTFDQLYDFRREYNAALVNSGVWPSHKSHRHHDGELCFGGGWFIVMMETPFGQISNHYECKYWDEFHCEEKYVADEWDGHTDEDVLERLKKCNSGYDL